MGRHPVETGNLAVLPYGGFKFNPVPAAKTAPTIRRGERVRLTEAARNRAELPHGHNDGVLLDVWVEGGRAVLLVQVKLKDRTAELAVAAEDVTKE